MSKPTQVAASDKKRVRTLLAGKGD
jgi:hypothetical protein